MMEELKSPNLTQHQIESIKKSYPSICYRCKRARRPASIELRNKGYVGCTLLTESPRFKEPHRLNRDCIVTESDVPNIIKAESLHIGWVNLSVAVFGQDDRKDFNAGISTNEMLMTVKCNKCKYYERNK